MLGKAVCNRAGDARLQPPRGITMEEFDLGPKPEPPPEEEPEAPPQPDAPKLDEEDEEAQPGKRKD